MDGRPRRHPKRPAGNDACKKLGLVSTVMRNMALRLRRRITLKKALLLVKAARSIRFSSQE